MEQYQKKSGKSSAKRYIIQTHTLLVSSPPQQSHELQLYNKTNKLWIALQHHSTNNISNIVASFW